MKIVSDTLRDADAVFAELCGLTEVAFKLYEGTQSYSEATAEKPMPLPRFVTQTTMSLKQALVHDFSNDYPNIVRIVINGQGDTALVGRLQTACHSFDVGQKEVYSRKCVLLADSDREPIHGIFADVVSNLVVFICCQFRLYSLEDTVFMSVHKYCESNGMTATLLYDHLLGRLAQVGGSWMAYDPMSAYCNALEDLDPILLEECRDAGFPLTDELASRILDGSEPVSLVRGRLSNYIAEGENVEGTGTLSSFISGMSLDG